jgi:hypothetical protein
MATYAQINPSTNQLVTDTNGNPIFINVDPAQVQVWQAQGNPKALAYLPVNITAQPTYTAGTQTVVQTGWQINTTNNDVEPVWQVVALTAAQQTAYTASQFYQQQITAVSDLNTLITTLNSSTWASMSAANQTTVIKRFAQILKALIQHANPNAS